MQIIPVLDILNGVVVRGVAGNRQQYRPIRSTLVNSVDPSVILKAIQREFGLTEFYVADLDSIQGRMLNRCRVAELTQHTDSLTVDRGVRCASDVEELLELDVSRVVVALETLPDILTASQLIEEFGAEKLVASIDMKSGVPLIANPNWQDASALEIARQLMDVGFDQFVVLDLTSVGAHGGISTLPLCRNLKLQSPACRMITGGGIRGIEDLQEAQSAGIDAVLIASALHDERLTADELQTFS